MAQMLPNGTVRFINDKYKMAEILVLQQRLRTIIAKRQWSLAQACLNQLDNAVTAYQHPES